MISSKPPHPPCWQLFATEMVSMEAGHVRVRCHGSPEHTNPHGVIQGGLLAAMIDNCIGPAVFSVAPDRQSSTIEFKVNFIAPVRPNEVLFGDARVIHHGRSTAYVETTLTREDGTLVARASATNILLDPVAAPASAP